MSEILQVDVTGMLLTGLRQQAPAVRHVTEFPSDLDSAVKNGGCNRVVRTGGGDDGMAIDTATITFDVIGADTASSRALAYQLTGAMYALRGAVIDRAVITYVRKLSGPVPLPYDNSNVRRQALTWRIAVKAQP